VDLKSAALIPLNYPFNYYFSSKNRETKSMSELEREAQALEEKGRIAVRDKQYDHAIDALRKAAEIYEKIEMTGQVGVINKEIKRIHALKELLGTDSENPKTDAKPVSRQVELEKESTKLENQIKTLIPENKFEEILTICSKLVKIYEELHYDYKVNKINADMEKYRNILKQRQNSASVSQETTSSGSESLSIAEERKMRLEKERQRKEELERKRQEEMDAIEAQRKEQSEREKKLAQERVEKARQERMAVFNVEKPVSADVDPQKKEKEEKERKLKELQKKKEREDQLLSDAESKLNHAKKCVDHHEYDDAKSYYSEASAIFQELGWKQQVEVLQKELKNLEDMKKKYEEKLRLEEEIRRKKEEEFEARAQEIMKEKERQKKLEEEAKNRLSPEMQRKVDTAEFVLQKAQNLEKKEKFGKAVSRYEYLIELYKELEYPVEKIAPIEAKIAELRPKVSAEEVDDES
jgi:hypothetical protein